MAATLTTTISPTQKQEKSKAAEWIMPIAAVGLIFVMLVPLPSFLLDLLLAVSMTDQRAGAALGHPDSASVAVLGISQPAAVADIVSPVAQPGFQPPDSAARQ